MAVHLPEPDLARRKKRRSPPLPRKVRWPNLEVEQILAWADAHYARTGQWPNRDTGPIVEAPRERWANIANALRLGLRGLTRGSSLARLLAEQRGIRNPAALPPFTPAQILAWADAHHARTGRWPTGDAGAIEAAPGETWQAVSQALKKGRRGLPGGSSLARLLEQERGVVNHLNRTPLTDTQILAWADAHRARTGRWPTSTSGPVDAAPEESWSGIHACLVQGNRGLPGGNSLARLLAERRGARRQGKPVRLLTVAQILGWADAHHARTGRWPTGDAGAIEEAPGEVWNGVDQALVRGTRGLPGDSSLARLLADARGVISTHGRPPLTEDAILGWADAFHAERGAWPKATSGPILEAPAGESWRDVDRALNRGLRGLPGGSSLARLLSAERGVRNEKAQPPLSIPVILAWADRYHARTGAWPTTASGAIDGAPEETWARVDSCLRQAGRELPAGLSLPRLLAEHRGVRNRKNLPPYSAPQILAWVDAYRARHGRWPQVRSGPVDDAPGETWAAIEAALQQGTRGLPGGDSLYRLIQRHRSG